MIKRAVLTIALLFLAGSAMAGEQPRIPLQDVLGDLDAAVPGTAPAGARMAAETVMMTTASAQNEPPPGLLGDPDLILMLLTGTMILTLSGQTVATVPAPPPIILP